MARYVLPVIGAFVGFVVGGPTGAMWGWSLGSAAGSIVDPQIIKGPGVGDIAQQTSQEGVPRPIVFGLSQPFAGNIIASADPEVVKSRKRQGKGGPKVETESIYRTYAIRICEGPISSVVRVWRNNQLVYDGRLGSTAENLEFLKTARFFLGTYDQNPSPDLEAAFGVGTTPAHRGTAYMVMAEEDLTDQRGAIPQWQFQVSNTTGSTLFLAPVNINAVTNAATTDSGGMSVGIERTVSYAGDRIVVKPNHDGTFVALSPWGVPALGGSNTGSLYVFDVIKDDQSGTAQRYQASGGPFNGYAAARAAFEAEFPNGIELTGATKYEFYFRDTPIGDNSGGISLLLEHYPNIGAVTLQSVVNAVCARAGMAAGTYDSSMLSGEVDGITIVNTYPAYTVLRSLSEVFFFDPSNYDGQLHFVPRGAGSVATITEEDMVDDDSDIDFDGSIRADSIAAPRIMHLNYFDVQGGLATDKQTSERAGDRRAIGEVSMQSAVVMESTQAARVVAVNHKIAVEELAGELKFSLPDSFLNLVSSNAIIVQRNGRSNRFRITKCEVFDGYQRYECMRDRQSAYTSNVEGIPAAPQTPPPSSVIGPTTIQPLDIHILRDQDDVIGLSLYIAVSGTLPAWQGALIELSYDGGQNYVDSAEVTVDAVMGTLDQSLGDHPRDFPDVVNTLTVGISTPDAELEETDLAGMLNGFNLAIVGNEIIQFANADETSEGHWELSLLLRGRLGTQTVQHPAGTRFVLLDTSSINRVAASITDIGKTLTFRATSFGETEDSAVVTSIVYTGRSQIEREAAYVQASLDGTDAIVSWQGVGRLGSGATVAHSEHFTGYRVTFSDGVAADIVVNTQLTQITQDVSSLSQPITISVAQVNSFTGAGPEIEVTV